MHDEIGEKAMAARDNIPRHTLSKMRAEILTAGDDWYAHPDTNAIIYTSSGVQKMLAALNAEITPSQPEPHPDTSEPSGTILPPYAEAAPTKKTAAPSIIEAVVTRWQFANRHIIEGKTPAGKLLIRVHAADKYRPGMTIKCRITSPGHADIVGRAPRYVGRW